MTAHLVATGDGPRRVDVVHDDGVIRGAARHQHALARGRVVPRRHAEDVVTVEAERGHAPPRPQVPRPDPAWSVILEYLLKLRPLQS